MGTASKIGWTHHTFNPWRGCTKIAIGCANCYAETTSKRNLKVLGQWGKDGTRVIASAPMWREPEKWNQWAATGRCHVCGGAGRADPRGCTGCNGTGREGDGSPYHARVFCASLADVFERCETMPMEAWVPVTEARAKLFALIDRTPYLDWLLLTKRIDYVTTAVSWKHHWPHNVWIGYSASTNKDLDEGVNFIPSIGARVRFLSLEPIIESIDLSSAMGIHWVIVGGESGGKARSCDVNWIRKIVRQCDDRSIPCFVKQIGDQAFNTPYIVRAAKGGDPAEWPEDIRVQQFP